MKLSKQKLNEIFEWAKLFCDLSYGDGNRNVAEVIKALDNNTLEIEGYVRTDHFADADKMVSWTRFDPNDPKTFPKDDESVLVYYDGEIVWLEAHVCDGYCTFFSPEWNPKMKHITHWRPLPNPPIRE